MIASTRMHCACSVWLEGTAAQQVRVFMVTFVRLAFAPVSDFHSLLLLSQCGTEATDLPLLRTTGILRGFHVSNKHHTAEVHLRRRSTSHSTAVPCAYRTTSSLRGSSAAPMPRHTRFINSCAVHSQQVQGRELAEGRGQVACKGVPICNTER